MAWYYSTPTGQNGPITDSELVRLSKVGTINANTLVWTEGQSTWLPLASVRPDISGGLQNAPVDHTSSGLTVAAGGRFDAMQSAGGGGYVARISPGDLASLAEPLYRVSGWIKFLGVLSIIHGVMVALSIWGILICWLPIWLGMLLLGAATKIRMSCETNNPEVFHASLEDLGKYFKILGILVVVSIGIAVLTVLGMVAAMAFGIYKFNF